MSQTPTKAATSSESRFQAIFQAAVKSYQKQTKKDLLAHPLASQLESCDSTSAILAVLQDQVREFDKSHSDDERLTRWLGPTVNVLCAFSAAVSGGVGLVCLYVWALELPINYRLQVFSPANVIFAGIGVFISVSLLSISLGESFSRWRSCRQPKMSQRVKTFSQSYSNASDIFLHGSRLIQRLRRLRR